VIKIKQLVFLFILFVASVHSQPLVLDVTYSRWENDANKTTRDEIYSVVGSSMIYSLDYGGKSMPNEIDEKKECSLQQIVYERLIKEIYDNKINRNETIYLKERMSGENIFYLKLSVNLILDGTAYSILLEGESNLVMDNKAYLDVISFIKELRSIVRGC
jgi:hypothetical protein